MRISHPTVKVWIVPLSPLIPFMTLSTVTYGGIVAEFVCQNCPYYRFRYDLLDRLSNSVVKFRVFKPEPIQ